MRPLAQSLGDQLSWSPTSSGRQTLPAPGRPAGWGWRRRRLPNASSLGYEAARAPLACCSNDPADSSKSAHFEPMRFGLGPHVRDVHRGVEQRDLGIDRLADLVVRAVGVVHGRADLRFGQFGQVAHAFEHEFAGGHLALAAKDVGLRSRAGLEGVLGIVEVCLGLLERLLAHELLQFGANPV